MVYRQIRLGPTDPSFRALSGRLNFTVRRHKSNKDSLSSTFLSLTLLETRVQFRYRSGSILLLSSLLFSSLELSDTKSISLKYEPSSEPLHISAK